MMSEISAFDLHQMLLKEENIVVLDPREEGLFSLSPHIFQSINLPYSRIEWRLFDILPKKKTRIIVASNDNSLDQKTINKLNEYGYTNTQKLKGGLQDWQKQGFYVYTGFNTPSKAFGEFIESQYHTPSISPEQLNEWLQQKKDIFIVDSRTPEEHVRGTIPGSTSVPGAELALRLPKMITNSQTTIIVNCAGRTRSIIGTQSLRNINIPNNVYALRNGTMGWKLAGFEIEKNSKKVTPTLDFKSKFPDDDLNNKILDKYGIATISWDSYKKFLFDDDDLATYLFDVRMLNEYHVGHPRGATYAPGGQLIQATDTFIANKSSRVILFDNFLIRSAITGSWLKQMGYKNVYQLNPDDKSIEFTSEQSPSFINQFSCNELCEISAENLFKSRNSYLVIDLSYSKKFIQRHIDNAYWCVRSRLFECLSQLNSSKPIVLTSDEPVMIYLAGKEIKKLLSNEIYFLKGGNKSWFDANYPTSEGEINLLTEINDSFIKPFEAKNQNSSMKQYLEWEVGLVEKVSNDKTINFYKF
jgi:rhodanese-related sulfurtransferase